MTKTRIPSLHMLARSLDPFQDLDVLRRRLLQSKSESKHLEWKNCCPIGPNVPAHTKYRIVKAIISFANTEGGFVVCGVDAHGVWKGLAEEELAHVDPAKISELIAGVVTPEMPNLNYTEMKYRNKKFVVIHTPPSELMPHVTTKDIIEKTLTGNKRIVITRKAVYCRYSAKSDLATHAQFERIISRRTEFLKSRLLRTIKQIPVSIPVFEKGKSVTGESKLQVIRITDDPSAPVVRLTRQGGKSGDVFLHEELADGLFDEINNILEANRLLAKGQNVFLLGQPLYYRVYAERQHVISSEEVFAFLTKTALHDFYAPYLFWFSQLSTSLCANVILALYKNAKSPSVYHLLRLAILLGTKFSDWLFEKWNHRWRNDPQPPNFFWTFKTMRNRRGMNSRTLIALRMTENTSFSLYEGEDEVLVGELLGCPQEAAKHLSNSCMLVFEGDKEQRSVARRLDFLAYGPQIEGRAEEIVDATLKLAVARQDGGQASPP